ncbi:hypothetical protein ACGC1H_006517 [Rhizoctonia solani]
MSSPPNTPKQKKGSRQLLKEPFRSASGTTGLDEDIANGAPLVNNAQATTQHTNLSSIGASEQAGGAPGVPIIAEPVDPSAVQLASGQEVPSQYDPTATDTKLKIAPNDPPESHTHETPTTTTDILVETEPNIAPLSSEHTLRSPGTSEPQPLLPTETLPDQVQKIRNTAWSGLQGSLRLLRDSSNVFPQLSSAVDSLISCLDRLEVAVQNRQDFEDLASELAALSESLRQHMSGPSSMLIPDSTVSGAIAIERQTMMIKERLACASEGGLHVASMNEEELVKHYRKIQSHFRQLQTNASMITWSITNEHLVYTRLDEGLNPVKQAAYDSSLSSQISRRGCTEGTRIGVLDGLDDWLYDPTSPSIYWMKGMAGTGKTTIASTFCERVERRKLLAASFFCTRTSAECRDVTRIVPTIAYQLARYSIPFQSALYNILGQNPDIGSKNVLKQFEQLLKEPLQQVKDAMLDNLVVVIDALDECDDRNGVELVLDMLFRHVVHVPLKFLLTSRPEPEIYSKMATHAQSREVVYLHDIEKSLVQADIELYLKEELEFMSPRPGQTEIEQLVRRAGTLFIYAATLVRYIQCGKRLADPHKRLRSVLGLIPESTKRHTQIDALYTAVLKSALNEEELEADEIEDIRVVLRTVLFAQEPINVKTIAELAEINHPQRVIHALHPLLSVLHQSEETGLVSTLHASFHDFMFSIERSGTYCYDVAEHSQLLAQRCFLVMKNQLQFNICNLASSFVPDKEVEDIEERIKANIPPTLGYACRHWANHLALVPQASALLTLLDEFLCHRLLFWMEVLSLRRELPTGVDGLLKVQQWLAHAEPLPSKLMYCVDDARSFVTSFAVNPTSQSTPHIYLSSLSLCPHSSTVYQHYGKRSRGLLELKGSLMDAREGAPPAVWNVGSAQVVSPALSPDGRRVLRASAPLHDDIIIGINSVAFRPDGTHFLTSGRAGALRNWNATDGSFTTCPNKADFVHNPFSTLSPDGSYIASTHGDTSLQVINIMDGSLAAGPFEIERSDLSTLGFSRNNRAIIMGYLDGTIKVCDLKSGSTAVGSFVAHHKRVSSISESPDCSLLVSHSDYEMAIRVWNIVTPALDLPLFNTSIDPASGHSYAAVYDGWNIRDDGWVVNNSQYLLFWLPPDLAVAWCSPYATLAITRSGTLQVPKQKLFVGDQWTQCYVSD